MTVVENRGPELLAVCVTLLSIATLSMCLRVITRTWLVKDFGRDDYLMAFATTSFILFCASAITGIHYGTGRHQADLSAQNIEEAKKWWWLCYIWYCVTMISSKLSISFFLLRITIAKIHHYTLYLLMLLSVFTGLVFFFVTIFQCNPVTYFWDKDQDGMCIDSKIIAALTYLYSAINVIVDFTFALMPLHIIQGLQMHKRTKVALIPILGMGCIASLAVVVRFAYISRFEDPDFLWATLDIAIWSTIEQGLAITAGSLASLQPLIRWLGQRSGRSDTKPAQSRGSKDMLPKTIGSVDRFNAHKKLGSHFDKDTFGMATLVDAEAAADWDEYDGAAQSGQHSYPMKSHIVITRNVSVTSSQDRIRGVVEKGSEDELAKESSAELYNKELATPRSFLNNNN